MSKNSKDGRGVEVDNWQEKMGGPLEDCVTCEWPTNYFWGDGCCPLCPSCAEETTDKAMTTFCKEEGYGPIPEHLSQNKNSPVEPPATDGTLIIYQDDDGKEAAHTFGYSIVFKEGYRKVIIPGHQYEEGDIGPFSIVNEGGYVVGKMEKMDSYGWFPNKVSAEKLRNTLPYKEFTKIYPTSIMVLLN